MGNIYLAPLTTPALFGASASGSGSGSGSGSASASASASACALFCFRPTQRMANFRYGPIDTDSDSDPDAGVQGSKPWAQARINKVHALAWEQTSCPRHVARIEHALRAGFPVNAPGKFGVGSLHGAVIRGHLPIVRLLLRAGADPNNDPYSVLFPAVINRRHGKVLVEMLVAAGARVDARNGRGMTPLCKAVERENLPAVKALVAAGADVNATHLSVRRTLRKWVPFNVLRHCLRCSSVLDFLVSLPQLDLDTENSDGFTPEAQARDDGLHDVANTLAAAFAIRAARWTPLRSAWVAAVTTAAAAAATAAPAAVPTRSFKKQRQ